MHITRSAFTLCCLAHLSTWAGSIAAPFTFTSLVLRVSMVSVVGFSWSFYISLSSPSVVRVISAPPLIRARIVRLMAFTAFRDQRPQHPLVMVGLQSTHTTTEQGTFGTLER